MKNPIQLEIIMPVYNEEESVASTILSFYQELVGRVNFRFIISEDGSTDRTKAVLQKLSHQVPMVILSEDIRRGYSQGMLRALRVSSAPFVCCVDSDGQYASKDFWKLWKNRDSSDVVVGYRKDRKDTRIRVVMSRIFYYGFRFLFPENVHDPSCSYVLVRQHVIRRLIYILGFTNEGFWWEFMARVKQCNYSVCEIYVSHFFRKTGNTRVYMLMLLPAIVIKHIIAMMRVYISRPI